MMASGASNLRQKPNGKFVIALLTLILSTVVASGGFTVAMMHYSAKLAEAQAMIQWNNSTIKDHCRELQDRPTRAEVNDKVASLEKSVEKLEAAVTKLTDVAVILKEELIKIGAAQQFYHGSNSKGGNGG